MASTQVNKNSDSAFTDLFELLNLAKINGYKRIGDFVVENVPGTTTWKKVLSDDNKPLTIGKMVRDFYVKKGLRMGDVEEIICKKAVQVLEKSNVQSFEKIQYSRLALEFKNGVYILNDTQTEGSMGHFIKRGSPRYEIIRSTIYTSSPSYHDLEFDDGQYSHWSKIKTPHFDMILDHQGFSKETKKWMYILLGRLLYPRMLLDKWQVDPYLYGVPASGKTTILHMMCDIIGLAHVHKIDMNDANYSSREKYHGLRLLALDEATEDFPGIDDRVPIIIAGNKTLAHKLDRKIVTFEFSRRCEFLSGLQLIAECGKLLRKINEAYLEAVEEYTNERCIYDKLPTSLTDSNTDAGTLGPYKDQEESEEGEYPDLRIVESGSGSYRLSRM